jgi:hypothetical protein
MKLAAAAAVVIAFAAAACGPADAHAPRPAASAPADASPPHLEVSEKRVSFGVRFDDEEPEVSFTLTNSGGTTLKIEHVDTNCGCARVGETPKTLAPGASAVVRIRLKLDGMSGALLRSVSFHTDDPSQPVVRATMAGEIRPRLGATPARLRIEPDAFDVPTTIDVEVTSGEGAPLDGLTAFTSTPGLTVAPTVTGAKASVRVTAAPFTQDFVGSVVLRLGKYERVLPVLALAPRDVKASPEKLVAGVVKAPVNLETRLVARKGLDWKVRSIETNRTDLTAEYSGGMLRVRIAEDAAAGALTGRVTVYLEGAKPDRVTVSVVAFVEK